MKEFINYFKQLGLEISKEDVKYLMEAVETWTVISVFYYMPKFHKMKHMMIIDTMPMRLVVGVIGIPLYSLGK